MSDCVVSIAADASMLEAAQLLVNCRVGTMPVVDGAGLMVGMVSEADLIRSVTDLRLGVPQRKVAEVMDRAGVTASEDTDLAEIARSMTARAIQHVPILRNWMVVGIVSRVDILRDLMSVDRPGADIEAAPAKAVVHDDERLRREVRAACQGRVWSLAKQMDVVVRGGTVHLWGIVPSDLVRQAYQIAAGKVPGVKSVDVHMHIVPPPATRIGL
jgi:CBS domain-containing protein